MNKVEENIFAARRLLNERRAEQLKANNAKRDPERYKRIMPVRVTRRLQRGAK
jgi:hypothetical protein